MNNPRKPTPPPALRDLFLRAIDIRDPHERDRYLKTACANHPALLSEVRSLIASHKDDGFLSTPAIQPGSAPDHDHLPTVDDKSRDSSVASDADPAATLSGASIRYFGDYDVLGEIARGGMGIVYRARQKSLNRIVALKMIRAGRLADKAEVLRFRTEAEAAANLQHPNIVAIHEIGEHEGQHYFSMDYVEGKNLAQVAGGKPLGAARSASVVRTIAEAIHYAHQRGTLHRDLKPHNILIDPAGQVRITDFGLAKMVERESTLTQDGVAMGSPSYMSPEQADGRGDRVGPTSDVYSIGAILYELLTGRPPFRGETVLATLVQVRESEPVHPSKLNTRVPTDLETICLKCLEKQPELRYPTAGALAEDLGRFLNHEPILARPASVPRKTLSWCLRHPWVVTGVFSLLLVGLIGFAEGLWERMRAMEWKMANPGKAITLIPGDFFSPTFAVLLFLEFLTLQMLPYASLLSILRRQGEITRNDLRIYAGIGLGQVTLALYLALRANAAAAWIEGYWGEFWFILLPTVSNAWFGMLVLWHCWRERGRLQQGDQPDQPGTPAPSRIAFRPLAAIFSIQIVVLGIGSLARHRSARIGSSIELPLYFFSSLAVTVLIVLGGVVRRTGVIKGSIFAPILVIALLITFAGLLMEGPPDWLFFGVLFGLAMNRRIDPTGAPLVEFRHLRAYTKPSLVALLCLSLGVGSWVAWGHRHGKEILHAWMTGQRGRSLDPSHFLPVPTREDQVFRTEFKTLAKALITVPIDPSLVFGMGWVGPDSARALTRTERLPYAGLEAHPARTWADLDAQVRQNLPTLEKIKLLLREPHQPRHFVHPVKMEAEEVDLLRAIHRVSKVLYSTVLSDLHAGARHQALDHLLWLADVTRFRSDEPLLVLQQFRTGLAQQGVEAIWETLQDPDWTEPQLATLQHGWEGVELISHLLPAMEYEQALNLAVYDAYRTDFDTMAQSWQNQHPYPFLQRLLVYPLWSAVWSYEEQIDSLIECGRSLDTIRASLPSNSWPDLQKHLQAIRSNDSAPRKKWMFPMSRHFGPNEYISFKSRGYSDFSVGGWFPIRLQTDLFQTAMQRQTELGLAITAIALHRYHILHGQWPSDLRSLVPSLLAKVPTDYMDGQPLRYRLMPDGAFRLYSVGENGVDNGGDPNPPTGPGKSTGFWTGKDTVWPRKADNR